MLHIPIKLLYANMCVYCHVWEEFVMWLPFSLDVVCWYMRFWNTEYKSGDRRVKALKFHIIYDICSLCDGNGRKEKYV